MYLILSPVGSLGGLSPISGPSHLITEADTLGTPQLLPVITDITTIPGAGHHPLSTGTLDHHGNVIKYQLPSIMATEEILLPVGIIIRTPLIEGEKGMVVKSIALYSSPEVIVKSHNNTTISPNN